MAIKAMETEIKGILQRFIDFKKYKVFVFGSRAAGKARKFSDYDIGVIGQKPLDFKKIALIKGEFEESDLPYRVDVVDFSTVSKNFKNIAMSKIKKL
ncbi:MAG: nucleotidyltransferase domain-containing protein [Patescibacteria group bacterium]